ncbi:MAG: winged helix DNA-binding domain-containing protein [Gaiellaceae bacterium]
MSQEAERVLTLRELNRATLARQLLLRRARLTARQAVQAVGALQAQLPSSPYLALWSRLDGFHREKLVRGLQRRAIVKATLMRGTLHLVSSADYLAYAGVFSHTRSAELARRLDDRDLEEKARRAAELASEPRTRQELLELLSERPLRLDDRPAWLVWHLIQAQAGLVLAPESAMWRRTTGRARFVSSAAWLGGRAADGPAAVDLVVRRYLRAFGPASVADAMQWTGLPATILRPQLERIATRRFRDEEGRPLFDLPRAPIPAGQTPVPPRLLPMWDSILLAHDDRSRVLPDEYRKLVIAKNGDVAQTFLVDGVVAGTWEVAADRVVLRPFAPLPRVARRELEEEAGRLEAWLGPAGA